MTTIRSKRPHKNPAKARKVGVTVQLQQPHLDGHGNADCHIDGDRDTDLDAKTETPTSTTTQTPTNTSIATASET